MIKILSTRFEFDQYRNSLGHDSVGLVPTMGNLHEGHLSLLKQSMLENMVSVITIFVNPKQFGPSEDFDRYPRTLEEDISKISQLAIHSDKEIIVFVPKSIQEIYPENFNSVISIKGITQKLEGRFRPDHFDGVSTVVYRLFVIVAAKNAYFGQKDFQQCAVIKQMVNDLELKINIVIMPIIRNSEGLALSSRNQYLSEDERIEALTLPRTLQALELLILEEGNYDTFVAKTLSENIKWDYLEVLNAETLNLPDPFTKKLVIVGAYRLMSARLLDNRLVHKL